MTEGLRPETVEALLDLVEPEEVPTVDDAALLQLALGIADAETRLACARAMLASGEARDRLSRIRQRLSEELSEEPDVAELLLVAQRIERTLAEGRWAEGSEALRAKLTPLRRAWRHADRVGDHESVEAFTRLLLVPLMEMGEREEFDELAGLAHRAADALGPKLRRLVLSYQGVAASKRGDSAGAIAFWQERLRLAREAENRAVEADTLLDLAGQALTDRNPAQCRVWIAQAETALGGVERPDLLASLEIIRSVERRQEGDFTRSAERAERAVALLRGRVGADTGALVRLEAAKALALCGQTRSAIGLFADVLEISIEGGLGAHAAVVLWHLAEEVEAEGRASLALSCLEAAFAIDAFLGTRRVEESRERLEAARARHPNADRLTVNAERWTEVATEILKVLRLDVPTPV